MHCLEDIYLLRQIHCLVSEINKHIPTVAFGIVQLVFCGFFSSPSGRSNVLLPTQLSFLVSQLSHSDILRLRMSSPPTHRSPRPINVVFDVIDLSLTIPIIRPTLSWPSAWPIVAKGGQPLPIVVMTHRQCKWGITVYISRSISYDLVYS